MSTILVLLAGSALIGFVIGFHGYRVFIIILAAPIVAIISALLLRQFNFRTAVALTVACLAVNQVAYLIGAWLETERTRGPE